MIRLKKHTKERLIKRTEGIVSIFLIVLLAPFYSVAAILEEVGRYQSAVRGFDSAISASETSVLAGYDQFLMDRFALLAVDQNTNINQQFLSYLNKQDTQDTRSFSVNIAQTKASGVYPLADIEVLYQQINEFSAYTVPTKLILEGVNYDNIVSQLEGYSTTFSNALKQLNAIGTSLQSGLNSYNAQKEANDKLDIVTEQTGKYSEAYNNFKQAVDDLIAHKKTERPENEEEAVQWDEQLKNLIQKTNEAKEDYQNQISKESDGISDLAEAFDTAVEKERDAYDTLVDTVTTAVSTKIASEKDERDQDIQNINDELEKLDDQIKGLGKDPQGENKTKKDEWEKQREELQKKLNQKIDENNTSSNKEKRTNDALDAIKTGDSAKEVLKNYNSEACVDSLKGLNQEMKYLKDLDIEYMDVDSLENLTDKLHQVDLSKFTDTGSFKELWNSVRQSVGQENVKGAPMDLLDTLFAVLSIETSYNEDLNSIIDMSYYDKLPSQKPRNMQEYSLDSPYEEEDQKTAQENLTKIGLPISEADSVELEKGIEVGSSTDDEEAVSGNLFKKMIQMVNRLKKKMEGYKAVVDNMSNLANGSFGDKVLLMGYLTYSVSNRMNYDSGVALAGASFSGSGGLAQKYKAQNFAGEFTAKEETKYSFCGAEMEYLMNGSISEYENQKKVFRKLVALQTVTSIVAVANDPFVDGIKTTFSSALAAVPYVGPVLSVCANGLIPLLFSAVNGTIDTLLLVNGSKVQLFKTSSKIHVNPTGLASAIEELVDAKIYKAEDKQKLEELNKKFTSENQKNSGTGDSGTNGTGNTGGTGGTKDNSGAGNTADKKADNKKKAFDASEYGQSLNEFDYTEFMFILLMIFHSGSTEQLLNRFVDIIQMEETNKALTTNNTHYSLQEQLTGVRKKFDVDQAYTAIRAEVNGKFVNVLPVPTLSGTSAWKAHRVIYRGY